MEEWWDRYVSGFAETDFHPEFSKNPLCASCQATKDWQAVSDLLVNTVEHLAAKEPDISLRDWWRPKTELKESEYLTYNRQVDRNMIPYEC